MLRACLLIAPAKNFYGHDAAKPLKLDIDYFTSVTMLAFHYIRYK